ncbi:MAG: isoleucine--tRNA ligase [Oscillospiraceae bacterium]|jgi:isoleucyl-tRNA synthetase|nr:isoleucine--tRNA ligase [Oscillospiraceae bacterium]
MDYNKTLNLPETAFPMRAGLPSREPEMLKDWTRRGLYNALMEKRAGRPSFILHDGPPFSNGDIHMGHALNKILKDFVLRFKNMAGFQAPYIPGWDNHGMPIESAIIKKNKLDRNKMGIPEFREACHAFAESFVNRQSEQFQRLGILGDWENPYLTMDPAFEAEETLIFGEMFEKGYIYKGKKPVYWCAHDGTALAEAEIEYEDDESLSVYVRFAVKDDKNKLGRYGDVSKMRFVIWTTTAWTLPGNLAICLNPEFDYVLCENAGEILIIAEALKECVEKAAGLAPMRVLGRLKGREFEFMTASHPFLDRESLLIVGDHVTAEAGTGCVHTAPGHGAEDYFVCLKYKLPILVPVDDRGRMTDEAGPLVAGMTTEEASGVLTKALEESGALLRAEKITHPYPHCWRCHRPILFRATEQWFCSVDAIKDLACAQADEVTWYPGWGHDRMIAMVRERSDWCISRQRNWGLPIPVFYCESCKKPIVSKETVSRVADIFRAEGSNAWFSRTAQSLLPDGFACPHCGAESFSKETSTLDGWFDSGSSHAILRSRALHSWPADLYLEGGDQYRGWFQSSLLTAVATKDCKAPYRAVSTNGWVNDRDGNKMSKSKGNVLDPMAVCAQYGADILRLWVSSVDYHSDVFFSQETFKSLTEIYLKIRNTCRFLLGNLSDFDPDSPCEELSEIDGWALTRLDALVGRVLESYEKYEYHTIFHAIHNFCVIDMSNFYLDIIKDVLYCERKDSPLRRGAQTVLYRVLDTLTRLVAPVLAFTSEEIWGFMSHHKGTELESVLFNDMPEKGAYSADWGAAKQAKWEKLAALRLEVNKALETARAAKVIGKSLEAAVTIRAEGEMYDLLLENAKLLPQVLIVSKVTLEKGAGAVEVGFAPGGKCERCWGYFEDLGTDPAHPTLCPRCTGVVA